MTLTDEEKEKCEHEFSEFLIQKIKNLGGSLQFQYIINFLPQLSFEVKSVVGSSKVQLMKFLKSHPKKFKVDSKGCVTVIETPAVEDDCSNNDNDDLTMVQVKSFLPPNIQNGKGFISKLHPEFGFINAVEPIKTTVYFRASELSGDKDDLLAEHHLQVGFSMCFNAVLGHSDCDAKYRAIKVWRELEKSNDEEADIVDLRQDHFKSSKENDSSTKFANKLGKERKTEEEYLNGEGVIQKLSQHIGFISVASKEKDTVFFHLSSLEDFDHIDDLTKILKCGDGVEFAATINKKKYSAKWQAIAVWKKLKRNKQKNEERYISSDTEEMENTSSKSRSINKGSYSMIDGNHNKGSRKEMLKDQAGKISILPNGINITFGEKFTKIANGDSSIYFLYGEKVTDIPWEFSDGDKVFFDAVKIKAEPGWKAVLVWVGEKPDYVLPASASDFSEFMDEELDEGKTCNFPEKSVRTNTRSYNTEQSGKKKNDDHHDHSKQKFKNKSDRDYRKLRQPQSEATSQSNISATESNKNRQRNDSQIKDAAFSRSKSKQNPTPNRRVKHAKDHKNKYFSKNVSHQNLSISENSDNEFENQDNELQIASKFLNPHKNKQFSKKSINQPKSKTFTSLSESEASDSEHNEEVLENKKNNYGKSSIKRFQNINGKVTKVNCKFASAQSPDLQETVHFFLNAFYINGQSVEEQHVDDLREEISPGVTVKLNCFEIVDDSGKLYHKVTMAWLGEQPKISEITPEEFIDELNLSVTVKDDELSDEDLAPTKNASKKFIFAASNSDSEKEIEGCASPMKFSSSENASDDETSLSSKCSKSPETKKQKVFFKKTESSVNYKLLSEIVCQQLESKGLHHPDSEINLNALSANIVDVIVQRFRGIKESDNQSIKRHSTGDNSIRESTCPHCAKVLSGASSTQNSNLNNKAVQTIFTGEIVAQSMLFTSKKKRQVSEI